MTRAQLLWIAAVGITAAVVWGSVSANAAQPVDARQRLIAEALSAQAADLRDLTDVLDDAAQRAARMSPDSDAGHGGSDGPLRRWVPYGDYGSVPLVLNAGERTRLHRITGALAARASLFAKLRGAVE